MRSGVSARVRACVCACAHIQAAPRVLPAHRDDFFSKPLDKLSADGKIIIFKNESYYNVRVYTFMSNYDNTLIFW